MFLRHLWLRSVPGDPELQAPHLPPEVGEGRDEDSEMVLGLGFSSPAQNRAAGLEPPTPTPTSEGRIGALVTHRSTRLPHRPDGSGGPRGALGEKEESETPRQGVGPGGAEVQGQRGEVRGMNTHVLPLVAFGALLARVSHLALGECGGTLEDAAGRRAEGAMGPGAAQPSELTCRKLIPGPGVLSPCLHPLPPRPGARQGQEAPRDPAPHHGQSDQWGPSRPVGEEGRRRDPQTLSPWRPLETQQLPDRLQHLPRTLHSPGPLSLPLLQADPAVPGALGGQWVPQILPNLAHQGIPATEASVRPAKGETTAPDTRACPATAPRRKAQHQRPYSPSLPLPGPAALPEPRCCPAPFLPPPPRGPRLTAGPGGPAGPSFPFRPGPPCEPEIGDNRRETEEGDLTGPELRRHAGKGGGWDVGAG